MSTYARIRFYIYTAILILVVVAMPTPDPMPIIKLSAEVISTCEVAFWVGRLFQYRHRALLIGWLSIVLIFLGSLIAVTVRSEMRRRHELFASGDYSFPSRD